MWVDKIKRLEFCGFCFGKQRHGSFNEEIYNEKYCSGYMYIFTQILTDVSLMITVLKHFQNICLQIKASKEYVYAYIALQNNNFSSEGLEYVSDALMDMNNIIGIGICINSVWAEFFNRPWNYIFMQVH